MSETPLFPTTRPLDPDEALAAAEAAELASDVAVLRAAPPAPIGRSWAYDFRRRRFVRAPGGGVQQTRGEATLRAWIQKALITWRGGAAVHPPDYGMDDPTLFIGSVPSEGLTTDYRTQITECLLVHPRIVAVKGVRIEFATDLDYVEVSFEVLTDEDNRLSERLIIPNAEA